MLRVGEEDLLCSRGRGSSDRRVETGLCLAGLKPGSEGWASARSPGLKPGVVVRNPRGLALRRFRPSGIRVPNSFLGQPLSACPLDGLGVVFREGRRPEGGLQLRSCLTTPGFQPPPRGGGQ